MQAKSDQRPELDLNAWMTSFSAQIKVLVENGVLLTQPTIVAMWGYSWAGYLCLVNEIPESQQYDS